jgi:hypothetical protein
LLAGEMISLRHRLRSDTVASFEFPSPALAEMLKFFGNYDDIRIRGQQKRSQNKILC